MYRAKQWGLFSAGLDLYLPCQFFHFPHHNKIKKKKVAKNQMQYVFFTKKKTKPIFIPQTTIYRAQQ